MTEKTVTTDEKGAPTLTPQPKVVAGAVTGIILTVVLGVIAAVTPDMFTALGAGGVLIYSGIVALGSALAAYVKKPSADIN